MLQITNNIRLAGPEDVQAVTFIYMKMLADMGVPPPVPSDKLAQRLGENGIGGGKHLFDCLIGFHRMRPSGLLIFSKIFDAQAAATAAVVQSLFVTEPARQNGLGRELMAALAHLALKNHWSRIDWHVDRTRKDGILFYRKLVGPQDGVVSFTLSGQKLEHWARAIV